MTAQWHLKLLSGTVLIWVGLMVSPGLVRGQGGTGREPGPPSTPRARPTEPPTTRRSRPSNATGNSGPTASESAKLKEALQFVQDTVEAHPGDVYPKRFAQLDGCTVEIAERRGPQTKRPDRSVVYTFSLADINPESIVVQDSTNTNHNVWIKLATTASKNSIREVDQGDPRYPDGESMGAGTYIEVYDLDTANHIVNALKRAIGICGGKPDPF